MGLEDLIVLDQECSAQLKAIPAKLAHAETLDYRCSKASPPYLRSQKLLESSSIQFVGPVERTTWIADVEEFR